MKAKGADLTSRDRHGPADARSRRAAPDYGIDAPGVRRAMLWAGAAGAAVAVSAAAVAARATGTTAAVAMTVAALAVAVALYGLGMGAYMTYVSRVGKRRTRERLLDLAQAVRPWTGSETVLDVGCGRGLMLVGAARRLKEGRAVGVDLWRADDQSGNSPAAALENARREGAAGRICIATGDARALPFADAGFDAVLSHWVVHNLPMADRLRAIDEMVRVLRPGGVLVLADIAGHAAYRAHLQRRGLASMTEQTGGLESRIAGFLSFGSFRPHAIVGRRGQDGPHRFDA